MFYIHPTLTFAYLSLLPPLTFLQNKISASIMQKRVEFSRRRGELNVLTTDILQNIQTIKSFNAQDMYLKKFDEAYERLYIANFAGVKVLANVVASSFFTTLIPTFLLVFFAGRLVLNNQLTVALFITYTLVAFPIGGWLKVLSQQIASLRQAYASEKVVADFISYDETKSNEEDGYSLNKNDEHFYLTDVTFEYDQKSKVLDKFNAVIKKGKITALVGESGSGKSTIAKLLLNLQKPCKGSITLSSDKIAYVPQNSHLFPVSIKENIIGGSAYDSKKFKNIIRAAKLESIIATLPEAEDTIIEEAARNVSGGQRQRIAFARALYFDSDLIILDEATSGLDAKTENELMLDFIEHIRNTNKTALIITHSGHIANMADAIIQVGGKK